MTTDRSDDLRLLEEAIRAAGAVAHEYFTGHAETWEKTPGDPVTEADLAVDKLLNERLCGARPDYAWLSEETADDGKRHEAQRVWVVDPIDGTRAFVKRKPEYTVCAGLVEDGRPVLGAVFNPETDDLFLAEEGRGATHNGKALTTASPPAIEQAKLLTSRRTLETNGISPIPEAEFTFINSIAWRMVLVAAGRYDATISVKPKSDWDIAAAHLVATEAGYGCAAPDGKALVYNRADIRHTGVVVAAEPLFADIIRRLEGFPLSLDRD